MKKAIVIFLIFFVKISFAGINYSPTYINIKNIDNISNKEYEVTLKNQSNKSLYFDVYLVDNLSDDAITHINSLKNHINILSNKSIEVSADSSQKIKFKFNDKKIAQGDFISYLIIRQKIDKNKVNIKDKYNVNALYRLAVPITVRNMGIIKPRLKREVKVGKTKFKLGKLSQMGGIIISNKITNNSDFDIDIQGSAKLINKNDKKFIERCELYISKSSSYGIIYPGETGEISCHMKKNDYKNGNYISSSKIDINIRKTNIKSEFKAVGKFIINNKLKKIIKQRSFLSYNKKNTPPIKISPEYINANINDDEPLKVDFSLKNIYPDGKRKGYSLKFISNENIEYSLRPKQVALYRSKNSNFTFKMDKMPKKPVYGYLVVSQKYFDPIYIPVALENKLSESKLKIDIINNKLSISETKKNLLINLVLQNIGSSFVELKDCNVSVSQDDITNKSNIRPEYIYFIPGRKSLLNGYISLKNINLDKPFKVTFVIRSEDNVNTHNINYDPISKSFTKEISSGGN